MKKRKTCDLLLFFCIFLTANIVFAAAETRREKLEILLETLEDRILTVEEEILRREKSRNVDELELAAFAQIAVDSGGLPLPKLESILRSNRFEIVAKHPTLSNIFVAERMRMRGGREKRSLESWSDFESQFDWVEPLNSLEIQKRAVDEKIPCNDPHFVRQSAQFDKMGFTGAWRKGLTGNGITVAVVDDGIEFKASRELISAPQNAIPQSVFGTERLDDDVYMHGTMCAGVIAMRANNSECGVGGAPKATILDVPLLSRVVTDFSESVALSQRADIFTCSWGPPDDGISAEGPLKLTRTVIEQQANTGRNGRGALFVWASGNGGKRGDDCSLDGFVSNPDTIAVGWTVWNSSTTEWSEGCPAILTSVISDHFGGQVSVNGKGECVPSFRGSSAAAPLAAAGLALLLEKFPELSRRAVTHLIVRGSDPNHFTAFEPEKWSRNGAGLQFNRFLGFGVFSVERMLNLVPLLRRPFPPMHECHEGYKIDEKQALSKELSARLPFDGCVDVRFVETVLVTVRLAHPRRGDLNVRLKSPSGTLVTLLEKRPFDSSRDLDWTFTVKHFWGEAPNGDWVIQFLDKGVDRVPYGSRVLALSLTVQGTKEAPLVHDDAHALNRLADQPTSKNTAISSILFLLIVILVCLVVYGTLEFLAIRRKAKRTEKSWRILEDSGEDGNDGDEFRHDYKTRQHPPSEHDDDHLLVNEAFVNEDT